MAHRIYLDTQHAFGIVRWSGAVRGSDVVWAMEHLYGHPAWRLGFKSCWDGRGTSELLIELRDMKAIAALAQEQFPHVGPHPVANVIPNELHLVTVKMLARFTRLRTLNFGFFRTPGKAAAWLEIPPDWILVPSGLVAVRNGVKGTGTGS